MSTQLNWVSNSEIAFYTWNQSKTLCKYESVLKVLWKIEFKNKLTLV